MITTVSSRIFNQDTGRAKQAAKSGPVVITDRGKPTYVLLSMEEYQRIIGSHQKISELLAMPGIEAIEFEIPRQGDLAQSADFS